MFRGWCVVGSEEETAGSRVGPTDGGHEMPNTPQWIYPVYHAPH